MKVFLYSPFSPENVVEKNNPALLILFILKELITDSQRKVVENPEGPFAWTAPASSEQKLKEYWSLLPFAFPQLASQIPPTNLPFQELFTLLEPFILACSSNENILLFLLQHQKKLAVKPVLDKIYPEGMSSIREKIASNFRKRGYYFTQWTCPSQKL
jgi:hypothetical protein